MLFLSLMLWIASPLLANQDLGKGRATDILYFHRPGDPVNVSNGNFYLPVHDLSLACFTLPIELNRSYNSVSTRNGMFGKGWISNYETRLNVDEQMGLKVVESDGFVNTFRPVEASLTPSNSEVDKIVAAKKEEDLKYMKNSEGKGSSFYTDYRKKLSEDLTYFNRQKEMYLPSEAKISKSGKYVSFERGTVHLEKTKEGFSRSFDDSGRVEEFDAKGLLIRITDQNQNALRFTYDSNSRLSQVLDSCNQNIRFAYNRAGKVLEIQDSMLRKWRYEYDNGDRMTRSFTPDGERLVFAYDKKDRMTSLTFLDGSKTTIEYDEKYGQVTRQSGPGKKVTTYRYGRDGPSRYAMVEDNEGLKDKYEFIEAEHKTVFTDKNGRQTVTQYMACCGKPISIKNEKGVGDEFKYNDSHQLISKTDADKKVTTFEYETRFDKLSLIKNPDGAWLRFVYDNKGNVTYVS